MVIALIHAWLFGFYETLDGRRTGNFSQRLQSKNKKKGCGPSPRVTGAGLDLEVPK